MSRMMSPKIWYLVGIGAAALAIDGLRRWVKQQRLAAESVPVSLRSPDGYLHLNRSTLATDASISSVTTELSIAEPKPSPPAGKGGKDDLTGIKGIGPTYAKRLAAAGIVTFADLAASSPDRLREITRATPMADPGEWIAQADSRL